MHKLTELSEPEVHALNNLQLLQDATIAESNALRSLRFYAQQEQYAPLKRLLWVFEAGDRKASAVVRSSAMQQQGEDDDDVWDYPLS